MVELLHVLIFVLAVVLGCLVVIWALQKVWTNLGLPGFDLVKAIVVLIGFAIVLVRLWPLLANYM